MDNSNLSLWESVRTPDPAHTKGFSRSGGFRGTATNAVYLIRRATELWGPMGGKWGVEVLGEQVLTGAPILGKDGSVIGNESVHTIRINLRHPGGVVPGIGQTTFVGTNKHGTYTDEEAPKKSLTDAVTKALSWLGFAADVHLGLWDDNKYVADVKAAYAEAARDEGEVDKLTLSKPDAKRVRDAIKAAQTTEQALLSWASERLGYEITTVEQIPVVVLEHVLSALQKSIDRLAQETK